MKKVLIVLFFTVFIESIHSQLVKKDSSFYFLSCEINNTAQYFEKTFYDQPEEKVRLFSFVVNPRITYYFYKNFGIGASYSYEFYKSNFYQKSNFQEAGLYIKYVIPYTIDKSFLRRLHFYFEAGYCKTNFKVTSDINNLFSYRSLTIEEDFITSSSLEYSMIYFPIGIQFDIGNSFYFNIKWQVNKYIKGYYKTGFFLGIGYNF